ncbi:chaplin [Streptomyces sp. NPDC048639]|uniref:chaplin n=1 Tax=Streptomyces sp. NPDC048639 TaxID=3365581 RepID=UPI003722CF9E
MSRMVKTFAVAAAAAALVSGAAGTALADSDAKGVAAGSPGILSGNVFQLPIHIPLNLCGNTVGEGLFSPAIGNVCVNGDTDRDRDRNRHDVRKVK